MSVTDTNTTFSDSDGPFADAEGQSEGVVRQAQEFGNNVKARAGDVMSEASGVLQEHVGNLKDSAQDAVAQASEKLQEKITDQKAMGADYVSDIAEIVRRAAGEFEEKIPEAAHYIRGAAGRLDDVADAIRDRNVSEIVGNVQNFARQQPTAFFGAAVLIGFAAVRFMKSANPKSSSGQGSNPASGQNHA